MAAGFQVFDGNGKVIVDVSNRLTKILGILTIKRKNGNGTTTDTRLSLGTPFWIPVRSNHTIPQNQNGNFNHNAAEIVFNANTINWYWDSSVNQNCEMQFMYGVF